MTAERPPLAHRTDGTGHWLMFTAGQIVGCICGFDADLDSDCGWGDSVLDHIEEVVRAEERGDVLARMQLLADQWRAYQPGAFFPEASAYANGIETCGDRLADEIAELRETP